MSPAFSRSLFVPQSNGMGLEMIDLCVPQQQAGRHTGYIVGSVVLAVLLEDTLPAELARQHEVSFIEADGTRLARSGTVRGAGVYVADRVVDMPGNNLVVRVDARHRHCSNIGRVPR